jgi:hypothetical protein
MNYSHPVGFLGEHINDQLLIRDLPSSHLTVRVNKGPDIFGNVVYLPILAVEGDGKESERLYPVLHTPDWSKQFIMETDASGYALGAVLMQEFEDGIHPIAFNSRSLLPAEWNYDAHNKELTRVIFGFKCSQPFLLGARHAVHV